MKLSLVASTVFIAAGLAEFVPVYLGKPLNWLPSEELRQRKTCGDERAPYKDFTAETWAAHLKEICESADCRCTSVLGFSVPVQNDASHGREWYGEMFRGNSTTEADYVREPAIQDSIAYTLRQDE